MKKRILSTLIIIGGLFLSVSVFADDVIKIASWNIQNFGKAKAANAQVMKVIAATLSQFDIIAIQEISNLYEKSDEGCPQNEDVCPSDERCNLILDSLKNHLQTETDKDYGFILSPHVKDERYLFVYDKNKIQVLVAGKLVTDKGDDPGTPICDPKSAGKMLRQPFYATFKSGSFDFILVTAHTSPNKNIAELNALYDFYNEVREEGQSEQDIILLGDLNADCSYLRESAKIKLRSPDFTWVIDDSEDTTVRASTNCAYDRMIFSESTAEDYTGNHGVYMFDKERHLSRQTALKVSDHYPIWAEFYTDKDTDHK